MSKPDWKDAPDWAQYLGYDSTGGAYWHEKEPKRFGTEWYCSGRMAHAARVFSVAPRLERRPDAD